MFKIDKVTDGEYKLSGRLDAVEVDKAQPVFDQFAVPTTLDCGELAYISSAGLGLLIATQIRLKKSGAGLKLTNLTKFVRDVLRFSSFDKIIEIEER